MSADGTSQRRLTKASRGFEELDDPVWAPDGRRIAYVMRELASGSGPSRIEVVNVDGSARHLLVRAKGNESQPAWSPDGKQLAYESDLGGLPQIYVADRDGNRSKRVTPLRQPFEMAEYPAWSPDSQLIAFVGSRFVSRQPPVTNGAVYVIRPDGTHTGRLTRDVTGGAIPPRWSPNGNRIGFGCLGYGPSYKFETKRMCVVRRDGSGFAKLSGPATGEDQDQNPIPSWSPDGRWITYDVCTPLCRVLITPSSPGRWRRVGKPVPYSASPVWRP